MNEVYFDPVLGKAREKDVTKVTSAGSSGTSTSSGSTAAPLVTKDEGITLTSTTGSFDFVGAGVTATTVGNDVTVTIGGGGGGGTPGGADTQVQYNNATAFGGITGATTNGTVLTLTSPVFNTGVSGTAIDTAGTLANNSDTLLASQKAVKTYADTKTTLAAVDAQNLSVFAATTSLQLKGVISDETGSGALTFATSPTFVTPTTDSLTISGDQSVPAWTTNGVRFKGIPGTLTDTTSSGTVATAYTSVHGGSTIAASSSTTFTNYFGTYFTDPVAGTNVTMTNKWGIGSDSAKFGTSNQLTISTTGVLTATSPVFSTPTLGVASATQITTPLIKGSSGLTLQGDTAINTSRVFIDDQITLLNTHRTFTASPGNLIQVAGTYTLDFASASISQVVGMNATVKINQNPGSGMGTLFNNAGTYQNVAGSGVTSIANVFTLVSGAIMGADTDNLTQTSMFPIIERTQFKRIAGTPTLTVTDYDQFSAANNPTGALGMVATGVTITNRRGVRIYDPTGSGTITNNYGIDVEAQTKGTTDIGVRIAKADTMSLNLSDTGGTAAGGITFRASGSANLYSSAASTIKTDGAFIAGTSITSIGATSGVGYAVGAGGAVTQGTSRVTGVTLSTVSGAITLFSQVNTAVSAATVQTFTVTNTAVAVTDTIIVNQKSGTDLYEIFVTNVAAGSFKISSYTTGGVTNEAPVFTFNVIKGVVT